MFRKFPQHVILNVRETRTTNQNWALDLNLDNLSQEVDITEVGKKLDLLQVSLEWILYDLWDQFWTWNKERARLVDSALIIEMISISEDLWDQINKLDQFKDGSYIKDRLKNSLRSFTYNYIDLDLQFHIDNKRIRILRSLNTKFAILKPNKGSGIVILKRSDYIDSLYSLFNDPTKFKRIPHDLKLLRDLPLYRLTYANF